MAHRTMKLKAYKVGSNHVEASVIVFSESVSKAKSMALKSEWLCDEDWVDLSVTRIPEADQYINGKPEMLGGSGRRSAEIMHALGWYSIDNPSCEWCGTGQWDGIPESIVEYREDVESEICAMCYQHHKAEKA